MAVIYLPKDEPDKSPWLGVMEGIQNGLKIYSMIQGMQSQQVDMDTKKLHNATTVLDQTGGEMSEEMVDQIAKWSGVDTDTFRKAVSFSESVKGTKFNPNKAIEYNDQGVGTAFLSQPRIEQNQTPVPEQPALQAVLNSGEESYTEPDTTRTGYRWKSATDRAIDARLREKRLDEQLTQELFEQPSGPLDRKAKEAKVMGDVSFEQTKRIKEEIELPAQKKILDWQKEKTLEVAEIQRKWETESPTPKEQATVAELNAHAKYFDAYAGYLETGKAEAVQNARDAKEAQANLTALTANIKANEHFFVNDKTKKPVAYSKGSDQLNSTIKALKSNGIDVEVIDDPSMIPFRDKVYLSPKITTTPKSGSIALPSIDATGDPNTMTPPTPVGQAVGSTTKPTLANTLPTDKYPDASATETKDVINNVFPKLGEAKIKNGILKFSKMPADAYPVINGYITMMYNNKKHKIKVIK